MFSWANYYRQLLKEAKERAGQASDLSVQAKYKELATD
jgi:hypothetical protein